MLILSAVCYRKCISQRIEKKKKNAFAKKDAIIFFQTITDRKLFIISSRIQKKLTRDLYLYSSSAILLLVGNWEKKKTYCVVRCTRHATAIGFPRYTLSRDFLRHVTVHCFMTLSPWRTFALRSIACNYTNALSSKCLG